MHCDITGFTAMSESLAELGKEGAELMVAVLNRFFDKMLEVAERWGGVQMKFGGDAMLLFFSGRENAARAAACGLEMQTEMAGFRRVPVGGQVHRLRMRIGIHSGRFFSASVGQQDGVLHYMLLGPDVSRTAAVEPKAAPGQVVVSAETAAVLGPQHVLIRTANPGIWRVRSVKPPGIVPDSQTLLDAPSDVLRRYLMPPLAEGRTSTVSGEHRRVTTLFINLFGVSELLQTHGDSQALAQVDAYAKMLISALERYGGFLAGSDVAEEGDKLIALFGAPVSHEQEEAGALRCAVDLQTELQASGLDLRQRIGINSGYVFAGEVGSGRRREYTVIGDSVNLAARLMAAARPGQVLVSAATTGRAGAEFDLHRSRSIRVKGKTAPVQIYRLEGAHLQTRPQHAAEGASPVLGREEELAALLKLGRPAAAGRGRWAYISGEPGIGKSRLVAEVAARLGSQGWQELVATCQAHTSSTPFAPWREPLRALFGIDSGSSPRDAWEKLKDEVGRLRPDLQVFAPLVGELLSLPIDEEPLLSSLDAKDRLQRLRTTVVALLRAVSQNHPLLLWFEDAHWADSPSLELLAAVLAGLDSPLLVLVTSRQDTGPSELAGSKPALSLRLQELAPEEARRLVASASGLAGDDVEAIVARAQGNPLFLQEMARGGGVPQEALPETINDVIMVRVDRLSHNQKTILCLASVIGPSFSLPALKTLLGGRPETAGLEHALAELAQAGFTRDQGGDPHSYAFSHGLTREVVYETLPYAQRRQLHRGVAVHIEREQTHHLEPVCELLLHHYELAADAAKTVRYAAMSGDRAEAVFAHKEAIDYYHRSLAALDSVGRRSGADRSLVLERIGDSLETAGRHREAAEAFAQGLREWRESRQGRPRLVPWATGRRTREAALCRKVAVSCERRSDYDESLRWVDQAMAVLPRRPGRVGAQVYAVKSMALFRKGLYEEAIHWGRLGLALSRHSADQRELAYAHRVLAGSYMELGNLKQALHHDQLAVRFYHDAGDVPGQAMAHSNVGACYQLLGALDDALHHYEISLKADERVGNVVHSAIVHNNIGEVLLVMGRPEEAVAHLEDVVRLYGVEPGLAAVAGLAQVNISRCRLAQGDLDSAEAHIRRGLRLLRRVGAQGLLSEARLQLAELRLAQGQARKAQRECLRALGQAKAVEARLLEARGERLLGLAQAALGKSEAAWVHLRTSVALSRRIGADHEEARSLIGLARLSLDTAAPSRLQTHRALWRAAAIFSQMGAQSDLAEARQLLSGMGTRWAQRRRV